jgi:hypothetical protein
MTTKKETLRAQFDYRTSLWRIAKKTDNGSGGWRSFGSGPVYASREIAEAKIQYLIENNPDNYKIG